MTYTKTFELFDAWAETIPWDCLIRDTGCVSSTHDHSPMVNQPCAIDRCAEPLLRGETCYAVTQLERLPNGHEPWVCWRHVRPDDGPIRVSTSAPIEEDPS
jgi:hypothetical protein